MKASRNDGRRNGGVKMASGDNGEEIEMAKS